MPPLSPRSVQRIAMAVGSGADNRANDDLHAREPTSMAILSSDQMIALQVDSITESCSAAELLARAPSSTSAMSDKLPFSDRETSNNPPVSAKIVAEQQSRSNVSSFVSGVNITPSQRSPAHDSESSGSGDMQLKTRSNKSSLILAATCRSKAFSRPPRLDIKGFRPSSSIAAFATCNSKCPSSPVTELPSCNSNQTSPNIVDFSQHSSKTLTESHQFVSRFGSMLSPNPTIKQIADAMVLTPPPTVSMEEEIRTIYDHKPFADDTLWNLL
ncbi:hypothetical protein KP509_05G034700 [Ceratopteris richardii]|uniref:Uncharacterized protein n=1 Tax=Ceratopteris richardii TaxID=49495 RepID=A0A8T2USJ3_CERRI|nr:hypothetical protein KP509_05G034700 [Ceratopteris richardii]